MACILILCGAKTGNEGVDSAVMASKQSNDKQPDESRGNICVAPALRDHLAQELQKEMAVAKERRKAREESQFAREAAPPKGRPPRASP